MRAYKGHYLLILLFLMSGITPSNTGLPADAKGHGKSTVEPSKDNSEEGKRRFNAEDYPGAIDALLQSIYFARNGYNPDAYFWLGSAYAKTNQDAKAIEALHKNIGQAVDPVPESHLLLGQIYLRNKRFNEARIEAGNALSQSPMKSGKAYNLLGQVYEAEGNLQTASDHYLHALGNTPWHYVEAWVNYAEVLMKMRSFEASYGQFRNLMASGLKDIPSERCYLDIGLCMLAKGNHQGAMDNWYEAIKYNPDCYQAHLQIALLLDNEHHFSSAVKEYKEYIRVAPNADDAQKIKARVQTLEQQLAPAPYVPPQQEYRPPPPTPEQVEMQKRMIEKDKENLTTPLTRDSGF
jgi:tetratricopeptide (TPR) repeat protein